MKDETSQSKADYNVENLFPKISFLRNTTNALASRCSSGIKAATTGPDKRKLRHHNSTLPHVAKCCGARDKHVYSGRRLRG
jgi:hypothetical protein